MFKRWMLIALCILPLISLAKIYKWTDEEGNLHFTDKPKQGATTVKLPKLQEYSAPKQSPEQQQASAVGSSVDYSEVSITQPEANATIRNNQGFVAIMIHTEPSLADGHKFQLILNSRKVGEPQTSPSFALKELDRGSHNIAIHIVNSNGEPLAKSEQITIHMHRPRVGMGKIPLPGAPKPPVAKPAS